MKSALPRALSSVGLALLLTSATIGVAFFGAGSWLTLVPAGAGALLLGAGVALGARRVSRAAARLALETALVACAVVAVNIAALQSSALVDVTASGKNTLAEASVFIAAGLRAPVVIEAALDPADRAWTDLEALVRRYQAHTTQLTLTRVPPPEANALDDAKVRVRAAPPDGERVQKVRFVAGAPDQEQVLTNALRAVSSSKRARAYVLAGEGTHGVDVSAPDAVSLRRMGQALADEGLDVVPLPLDVLEAVPDDAALVVVAAHAELPAPSVAKLQRALDAGGRLLVLVEPGVDGALAGLLGSVGIGVGKDVVVDASAFSGLLGGPETATGVAYASHPVTGKLGAALTHFPRARSLAENPIDGVVVTALVQTGAEAYGETGAPGLDDGDVKGPMTLAMAAQRDKARVVVVGDASFATNAGLGLGANEDLAVHAALWLADREDAILIRPRGRGGNLLLLSPTARERIAFTLLYGLPVLLLATGLTVRAVRRR